MLLICSWHNNGCNCCVFANNEDVFRSDVLQAVEKLFKQNTSPPCTIVRQMLLFRELLNSKRILHNQKSISTKWNLVASLEACFQVTWGFGCRGNSLGGKILYDVIHQRNVHSARRTLLNFYVECFWAFLKYLWKLMLNLSRFVGRKVELEAIK